MKYKIGDKVTLTDGNIMTIDQIDDISKWYRMKEDPWNSYTDEMIEGLAEEETKPKVGTALNPIEPKSNANCITQERVDELATKIDKDLPSENQNVWELPDGYQFVDENGNVINATKIVLEKKKKEYPTTIEECCEILGLEFNPFYTGVRRQVNYKDGVLHNLKCLLIYRDAYWKIAGEELGLGKPWKPSDSDYITGRYCIFVHRGNIICDTPAQDCILTFPTEEMRDAFYENFKEEIEFSKELL